MAETTVDTAWFQEVTDQHNRDIDLAQQRLAYAIQHWQDAEAEYLRRSGDPSNFIFSDKASDISAGTYDGLKNLLTSEFYKTPDRNTLKLRIGQKAIDDSFRICSTPYDHTEIRPLGLAIDPGKEYTLAGVCRTTDCSSPRLRYDFYISSSGPAFNLANLAFNETNGGSIFIAPSIVEPSTSES